MGVCAMPRSTTGRSVRHAGRTRPLGQGRHATAEVAQLACTAPHALRTGQPIAVVVGTAMSGNKMPLVSLACGDGRYERGDGPRQLPPSGGQPGGAP